MEKKSANKKILFIVNPNSGNNEASKLEELIKSKAEKSGDDYKIFKMTGDDIVASIKKEIKNYKPDIVAACGGDGTINLAASLLEGTDISLLIVPFGSANGMAKEVAITSVEQSLDLLVKGETTSIDLLKINKKTCIHLADVGLNARIVKRFENDKKRGILTYAKHMFAEIFLLKQYRFKIKYGEKFVKRTAVSLTFANAAKYGTGAVINPNGKLDDGLFEIVIVKPFPTLKILSVAWKMFTGKLETSEYVEVIKCSEALVNCNFKTTFQIDGEVIGKFKEFDVSIMPNALKLIVPKK